METAVFQHVFLVTPLPAEPSLGADGVIHLIKIPQMTLLDRGTDGTLCSRAESPVRMLALHAAMAPPAQQQLCPVPWQGAGSAKPRAQPGCCRSPAARDVCRGGSLSNNGERNYVCASNNSFPNANSLL